MCEPTQKPAGISPVIEQHLIRVENRLNAVQMALEMMTVANYTNRKSTEDLLGDCERLQKAAVELHQAMVKSGNVSTFEGPKPDVDIYAFLSEAQGQASNARLPIQKPAPKTINQDSAGKCEVEFVFENVTQLAKYLLENPIGKKIKHRNLMVNDWKRLFFIKTEKAYKGLQVEIDGQQTTIKSFEDYCNHSVGMTRRMVDNYLKCALELGEALFAAFLDFDIGIQDMLALCKLSADQKQALLQVAQTGDKAATLAFIDQALQAGE